MNLRPLFSALLLAGLLAVYFGVRQVSTLPGKAALAAGIFMVAAGMVGFITMVKARNMVRYYGALSRSVTEKKEQGEEKG